MNKVHERMILLVRVRDLSKWGMLFTCTMQEEGPLGKNRTLPLHRLAFPNVSLRKRESRDTFLWSLCLLIRKTFKRPPMNFLIRSRLQQRNKPKTKINQCLLVKKQEASNWNWIMDLFACRLRASQEYLMSCPKALYLSDQRERSGLSFNTFTDRQSQSKQSKAISFFFFFFFKCWGKSKNWNVPRRMKWKASI